MEFTIAHAFQPHGAPHAAFHFWPDIPLMVLSTAIAFGGLAMAYRFYVTHPELPRRLAARFAFAYQILLNKYYVDEFYDAFIVRPVMWIMNAFWSFDARFVDGIVNGFGSFTRLYANWSGILDRFVVDGAVNGVSTLTQGGSRAFRLMQTGLVQNYLLIMALGVFVLGTVYLFLI